jgi:orotidine-5'-phosphate decarboxylase
MKLNKIIVALDNDNLKETIKIVKKLKTHAFAFKIGYQFFYNFGVEGYKLVKKEKVKIFLDLKLHDIPNTIKKGIEAIAKLNPYFLTIHISGGDEMLVAANSSKKNIRILGVSILTSLDSKLTKKIYNEKNIENIVSNFTSIALKNNLDGIICSPKEILKIKRKTRNKLLIITPGIRIKKIGISNDDQARTMTPKEAIAAGADYLVIGRPITRSKDPLKSLKSINESLK